MKVAAAILARVPAAYRHLPPDVKENDALAKAAIARDGAMIQWAPSYVQSDIDAVLLAVQTGKGPEVFPHVPRQFRSNKRVAMAAVEANGESIHSVDLSFRDDEDVILAASLEYLALPLASPRLLENDLLVRNICLRCQDTSIGPNLMPFLEQTTMLNHISSWLPNATILCRIRLLSGRAVLTSFSTLFFRRRNWRACNPQD